MFTSVSARLLAAKALLWLASSPIALAQSAATETGRVPLSEASRHVEFSTDEGTWMSLDVAPDGKKILFDLLGDIYSLPIAGGLATPILTGTPFDSQPRFSPDGSRLVFISDRSGADNVWVSRADGSDLRQISDDQGASFFSPVWAPSGSQLIVSRVFPMRRGAAELWVYPATGGAGQKIGQDSGARPSPLVSAPPPGAFGAVPSPDGRSLYFTSVQPRAYRSTQGPRAQIVLLDTKTGGEGAITFRRGNAFKPAISPDGTKLAYGTHRGSENGLRLRDLQTGEEQWLKVPIQRDELEARATRGVLPNYTFTPDSAAILLSHGGKIHRVDVVTGADAVIPFRALVSLEVTPRLEFASTVEQGPVRARLLQQPALAPQGDRVAFSALQSVYVAELTLGGLWKIAGDQGEGQYYPSFSPDGRWVAYASWTDQGGHVWKALSDGSGQPERLSDRPAFYRSPSWSPDGQRILVLRSPTRSRLDSAVPPDTAIIHLSSSGGDAHAILSASGVAYPHFGPDSGRIFLYATREGLISVALDGSDRRLHLAIDTRTGLGFPASPGPVLVSPDGARVATLFQNQLYLAAIPEGETPTIRIGSPSPHVARLTTMGADSFSWSGDGRVLGWTVGSELYLRRMDDQPTASPQVSTYPLIVEEPRQTPRGSIVFRGARLITMRGDEILHDADLVVTDNRIVAVGKRGEVAIPQVARIMDVTGKVIIPGLVDIHSHFGIGREVLDVPSAAAYANLAYGITSVFNPQSGSPDIFAFGDLIETGKALGPRVFSSGPGIFSTLNIRSLDDARAALARYREHYRTNVIKSYLVGDRNQRRWVVAAARELQLMATTEGGADFKMDLTHAIDGFSGNEHALPTVPIYRDVVQLYAQTGIVYTPTLMVAFGGPFALYHFFSEESLSDDLKLRRFTPADVLSSRGPSGFLWFSEDDHIFSRVAAGANQIIEAGGRVGLGGHGELQGLGSHWELWALAAGGMGNHDVLRVGTLFSAQALGYGRDLGSLEAGKLADLIILDANPLDDIRNTNSIRWVMRNGELFEGDTLDQVWPEQKPLPEPWWVRNRRSTLR